MNRNDRVIRNEGRGMTVTPRQFAGILGGLLLAAGIIMLLFIPISADYDAGMFGDQSVKCGTALAPDIDLYSGDPLEACEDALGERRAWGWPVALVGVVVVAGALLVRPAPQRRPETA